MNPQVTWESHRLDELGFVGRGKSKHRPRNDPSLYGGIYPFFQTGDVKSAQLKLNRYTQTYNEEGLKQSKLWQPGTLCITIAANIADTAILDIEGCFPDSIVGYVPDPNKADVRFVKYSIDTLKIQMSNISRGATQDNLSLDKLLSFKIKLPPIDQQTRIANVIAAYDELIENNQKRIEILQSIADLLYRHMFMDRSSNGLPDKWTTAKVSQLVNRISPGKLYSQKNVSGEGKVPVLDQGKSGIIGYHNEEPGVIANRNNPVIVFANHTCYQRLVFHSFSAIQNVLPFVPVDNQDIYWLHHATKDLVKFNDYKGHWPEFMSKKVIVPDVDASKQFGRRVKPIYELIYVLQRRNELLQKAHNILMPRVLSGEIEV